MNMVTQANTSAVISESANIFTSERITFEVNGNEVVGNLYFPANYQSSATYPAIIVGGSLTAVKEMMAGRYAQELADRDMMALAIDYRNYGESAGVARQFEDPALKAEDLSAAVSFLLDRPDVSDVGLLGICTSGGNVLYAAANDNRIAAVATVAGWFIEPSLTPLMYGDQQQVEVLKQRGQKARKAFNDSGKVETILAYHDTDTTASHVGPMEYYMDQTRGGGVSQWNNAFAVMSWEPWLAFDPVSKSKDVTAATLIVHSEGSALPDQARKVYDLLGGRKQIYWGQGNHFDYYDQDDQVNEAVTVIAEFFDTEMKANS